MKPASPGEYGGLIVGALILLVVLVASFMCIQLYRLRKAPTLCADLGRETFAYAPACGSWRRADCHRVTTGAMPAIEVGEGYRLGPCDSGALGVPP